MASTTSIDSVISRILELCKKFPAGVADKVLANDMPDVDSKAKAAAINKLLTKGKIDIFQSESGLVYRSKEPSKAAAFKGDQEEKIVYKIIEEAGNKGTWIRDIRFNSNLVQTQLTKILKSLETKKLIKVVKSVRESKKKVYMLYNLEPDRSLTGGAWYSDQDFESEFVDILNQQCFRFLYQKLESSRKHFKLGPIACRNIAQASSKEVLDYISELGISRIQLKVEDIEAILETIIFDGKVERSFIGASVERDEGGACKFYRAVESLLPTTGLMRTPCGICPIIRDCSLNEGSITPLKCIYLKEWLT